jgi:hypothetical protein
LIDDILADVNANHGTALTEQTANQAFGKISMLQNVIGLISEVGI